MRKLVIAGSYAQYRHFLSLHNVHPRAAVNITQPGDLRAHDPEVDEIVLVGTYADNPAYQSQEYWPFVARRTPMAAAV